MSGNRGSSPWNLNCQDNESHFAEALEQWKELNLSLDFVDFTYKVQKLCPSMVLLLHNWSEIVDHWLSSVESADDEALKTLLEYVASLVIDPDIYLIMLPACSRNWRTTSVQRLLPNIRIF